jgi:DNA-binding SARP family transcriptional activator
VGEVAELQFYLLGQFQACWDFTPIKDSTWRVAGSRPLVQLLIACRPDGVAEHEACRLLRLSPEALREAAGHLNAVLEGGAAVVYEEERLRIEPGAQCWVDVDTFRAHYRAGVAAAARGEMLPAIMAFQEADALYQGDYLEELQEDRVDRQRTEYQQLYTEILDRLAEGHAVLARYQDAIGFCHKALVRDPYREATYQRMMVYYYYLGAFEEAEEAYRQCRGALAEVGRAPGPETEALREQLQRRVIPAVSSEVAAARHGARRGSRREPV